MGEKVLTTPTGVVLQHPGSGMAYVNYGCRCDECKAFNAKRGREGRRRRIEKGTPEGFVHGHNGYTNWGCPCEVCVTAGKEQNAKDLKEKYGRVGTRRPDAVGPGAKLAEREVMEIHERLNLGETMADLAREYGMHYATIQALKHGKTWSELTGRGKS